MGTPHYAFVGSCPSLPAWFVNWVSEEDTSEEIEFDELESALRGNEVFDGYMRYRLEDIEIHPKDDWSITFLKGKTPTGKPFMVIQDAGIENVYVAGDFDLEAEKGSAEEQGFCWLTPNPTDLKKSLMPPE